MFQIKLNCSSDIKQARKSRWPYEYQDRGERERERENIMSQFSDRNIYSLNLCLFIRKTWEIKSHLSFYDFIQ